MKISSPVKEKAFRQYAVVITAAAMLFVGGLIFGKLFFTSETLSRDAFSSLIQKALTNDHLNFHENEIQVAEFPEPLVLEYSIDAGLQMQAEEMFEQYKPDFGALVAIDADSGRVLASASTNRAFQFEGIPAFRSNLPAASIFKVITAAAVIEEKRYRGESQIVHSGRDHTLYKSQLKPEIKSWRRTSSLKSAFAKSINSVFGRIGVFALGAEPLISYSDRFWFNKKIPSEFEIESSRVAELKDKWEIAEAASGFTKDTTLSPVHGAMIAAAIANDGQMMAPYFIQSAMLKSGKLIYRPDPVVLSDAVSPDTAKELRSLMRETVVSGTSRKAFRGFFKGSFHELDVGGKTGSLTAKDLEGKTDWFVGFASAGGRKIGIAVVTVHQKYWTVKSAYLARRTFEKAFQELRGRKPSAI